MSEIKVQYDKSNNIKESINKIRHFDYIVGLGVNIKREMSKVFALNIGRKGFILNSYFINFLKEKNEKERKDIFFKAIKAFYGIKYIDKNGLSQLFIPEEIQEKIFPESKKENMKMFNMNKYIKRDMKIKFLEFWEVVENLRLTYFLLPIVEDIDMKTLARDKTKLFTIQEKDIITSKKQNRSMAKVYINTNYYFELWNDIYNFIFLI